MRNLFIHLSLFTYLTIPAQDTVPDTRIFSISGFVDAFYAYDFNAPVSSDRQPFLFNHNRHNEVNINLALIRMSVDHARYRSVLAIQAGTYAADNYAAEPVMLRALNEAYAGIALNKAGNLWLDAGIFSSHLGFESAVSIDNSTLTRSLVAENSPYFLSGAKITYEPNEKWTLAGVVSNGWQRIQKQRGNALPGFGTRINHHPGERIEINWSTYIGSEFPDLERRMRYFNNFYTKLKPTNRINIIVGFDIGNEQRFYQSRAYHVWYCPVAIAHMTFSKNLAAALRGEYYVDPKGVIIATAHPLGFRTVGTSLNLDYAPSQNTMLRMEGRWFRSEHAIFERNGQISMDNFCIMTSIALRLE